MTILSVLGFIYCIQLLAVLLGVVLGLIESKKTVIKSVNPLFLFMFVKEKYDSMGD